MEDHCRYQVVKCWDVSPLAEWLFVDATAQLREADPWYPSKVASSVADRPKSPNGSAKEERV
jgi:hypothetical protein